MCCEKGVVAFVWCWLVWFWSFDCYSLHGAYVWVCVSGEYGKLEGLKVGVWYLCEFYEWVGMVCGMVDGL